MNKNEQGRATMSKSQRARIARIKKQESKRKKRQINCPRTDCKVSRYIRSHYSFDEKVSFSFSLSSFLFVIVVFGFCLSLSLPSLFLLVAIVVVVVVVVVVIVMASSRRRRRRQDSRSLSFLAPVPRLGVISHKLFVQLLSSPAALMFFTITIAWSSPSHHHH